jgi:hypothetical protein
VLGFVRTNPHTAGVASDKQWNGKGLRDEKNPRSLPPRVQVVRTINFRRLSKRRNDD